MKQRTNSDCGIVAVAVVTDRSYNSVRTTFGSCRDGMAPHELEWLLTELGFVAHRVRVRKKNQTLEEWITTHCTGRYIVSTGSTIYSHAVAVVDGTAMNARLSWYVYHVWKITCPND